MREYEQVKNDVCDVEIVGTAKLKKYIYVKI